MRHWLKRHWWRCLLALVLAPPLLVLLLGTALYIPAVQRWSISFVERQASQALGMQVRIGGLRLVYPLDLSLGDVLIERSPRDTMLSVGRLDVSISPRPLLSRQAIVPRLSLERLYYNDYDSLGSTTRVRLREGELHEFSLGLEDKQLRWSSLVADSLDLDYHNVDTLAKSDTTALLWVIKGGDIRLRHSSARISLPHNKVYVNTQFDELALHKISAELEAMRFELADARLKGAKLAYATSRGLSHKPYLDYEHITTEGLNLHLTNVVSQGSYLDLFVEEGSARERSGLEVTQLRGLYQMDSLRMRLTDLDLKTAHSQLYGTVDVPWQFFKGDTTAIIEANMGLGLALSDAQLLAGEYLPKSLIELSKQEPLSRALAQTLRLDISAMGTLNDLQVDEARLRHPGVVDASIEGRLRYLVDNARRRGKVKFEMQAGQYAQSLLSLAGRDIERDYRLPSGFKLTGDLDISRHYFDLKAEAGEGRQDLSIQGLYNHLNKQYQARLRLAEADLSRYAPQLGLGQVDMLFDLSGQGFDPLSPKTNTQIIGRINHIDYRGRTLRDISLDGALTKGQMTLSLNSFNPGLNGSLSMDGLLSRQRIQSSIVVDSEDIDFKALGLSDLGLETKFRLQGELFSDLDDTHRLTADIQDMRFIFEGDTIEPKQVALNLKTDKAQSSTQLSSGDLNLRVDVSEAPSKLMSRWGRLQALTSRLVAEIQGTKPMSIRLEELIKDFPALNLDVELGKNNALRTYLARHRLSVEQLEGHIRLRPSYGIEGHIIARDLRQDTLRLSCVDLSLSTERYARDAQQALDSMRLNVDFKLEKMRFRQQRGFSIASRLNASLQDAKLSLEMLEERGRVRHRGDIALSWGGDNYRLHIPNEVLTLASQRLAVNPDNYIELSKSDYFANAKLLLQGKDNKAQLSLTAEREAPDRQRANLSILGLRLEEFRSLGLPDLSGTLLGEVNYERQGNLKAQPVINGDVSIQNLSYEDKVLGHFATAFFYEPRSDASHYITADVSYRGEQALSLNGIYTPRNKEQSLRGELQIVDFPLELANPFSAPFATYLAGSVQGGLQLSGSLTSPQLHGKLLPRGAEVELREYATTLRLDSLPLRYEGTKLHFDNYALRSSVDPDKPIYLEGSIATHGRNMLQTDLRLRAEETTLMDQEQPKTDGQILYGRLVASANMRLMGKLNALKIAGQLGIKGGTNCTYVMQESTLDVSDKSAGLVQFKDFADTVFVERPVVEAELGGVDLNLTIAIDPLVRFNVDLSSDHQDYLRVQGGGNLHLRYRPYGEMNLRGRYEMSSGGTLQYTLPVVGSKQFAVSRDGYIAFDGDARNPYINLVATQRVRAGTGEASGAKTNFLVSIKLKDKVDNINLAFDLSAPEDLNLQNSLAAMSPEERGKQAIGLLATGTYLGGGSGGDKLKLNETFAALLQNQINTMAGSLLRGTDLSIGMEMNDGAGNNQHTSYTYSFSRRFYNDRIRVVIGGKIHTGGGVSAREQRLIDNVAVEYQLDKRGERFLQLYHKRVTDNVIEGEYNETGLGLYLRRSLERLSDVFSFGKKKKHLTPSDTSTRASTLFDFRLPTTLEGGSPIAPLDSTRVSPK